MNRPNETFHLPAPPGFQGLRDDSPLEVYGRDLPHWRQDGASYFVTFRLRGSLPQSKLRELRRVRAEWESTDRPPRSKDDRERLAREIMRRVERWLDQGMGDCILKSREASDVVVEVLHAADGVSCELGCYVVMPNHVHAVVRPTAPRETPLESILQRWKGAAAFGVNRRLDRSGTLWQRDSFDRIIRDEEHLYRVIQYIGRNPAKANLGEEEARLWLRPSWMECGWRFESPP